MHTFTYTRENLHPQLWRGHEIVLSIEFNKLQFWWSECLSKKRELKKSVSVILEWDLFDKKLVMTNVIHLSTRHWWRYLNLKEKLYQLFRMRSKTSHTTKNSVLYDDYFLHIMLVLIVVVGDIVECCYTYNNGFSSILEWASYKDGYIM